MYQAQVFFFGEGALIRSKPYRTPSPPSLCSVYMFQTERRTC